MRPESPVRCRGVQCVLSGFAITRVSGQLACKDSRRAHGGRLSLDRRRAVSGGKAGPVVPRPKSPPRRSLRILCPCRPGLGAAQPGPARVVVCEVDACRGRPSCLRGTCPSPRAPETARCCPGLAACADRAPTREPPRSIHLSARSRPSTPGAGEGAGLGRREARKGSSKDGPG